MPYPNPLIWIGTWPSPAGLMFYGFHVWDRAGEWVGVYPTHSKALAHALPQSSQDSTSPSSILKSE